jgi:hypothetical protein
LLSPLVVASVPVTASDEAHKVSVVMAHHHAVTAAVAEKVDAVAKNEASGLRRIQS